MLATTFTYESTWHDAQKNNWRVEELIGPDKPLDFHRPFLPDSLVRIADIGCLFPEEKLLLNHIRGNSYLHLFVLVEGFIIPMVVDQVKRVGYGDLFETQALLGFAEEEGKHIYMFQQFRAAFEQGFHHDCGCVGPIEEIAQKILAYPPLSVLLLTLQFEWTTQVHYLESVRHRQGELDPRFCDLLKFHWMEETQHTKLDTLLVSELVDSMPSAELVAAVDGYFELVHMFEKILMAQVKLDIMSFTRALADSSPARGALSKPDLNAIEVTQRQAYRWAFVCAGLTHPNFVKVLSHIQPQAKNRAIALAKKLSH